MVGVNAARAHAGAGIASDAVERGSETARAATLLLGPPPDATSVTRGRHPEYRIQLIPRDPLGVKLRMIGTCMVQKFCTEESPLIIYQSGQVGQIGRSSI